jgi:hypothetical protein
MVGHAILVALNQMTMPERGVAIRLSRANITSFIHCAPFPLLSSSLLSSPFIVFP